MSIYIDNLNHMTNTDLLRLKIAHEVRTQRTARNLTQSALGKLATVTRQTVIAVEAAQAVSGQSLLSVMAVLDISVTSNTASVAVEENPRRPTIKELMREQRMRG